MNKILPILLTLITQQARYKDDETFIKGSFSSNCFILFRKIFWRRQVPQPQMTSWNDSLGKGFHVFHTWESAIVHYESVLRQWVKKPSFKFKLVKVYIPVFAPVGMPYQMAKQPYLFTIAYDNSTNKVSTSNTTSPITQSHTCVSGSVGIGGYCTDNTVTDPTTLTYNLSAMTKAVSLSLAVNTSIWYITNPTTGSALTWSYTPPSTSWQSGGFTSWTGANTSSLIGVTGTANNVNTVATITVTTTTDNSYLQDMTYLNDRSKTYTPDSPAVLAFSADTGAGEGTRGESLYRATGTAGSFTLSGTYSGSTLWRKVVVEIKPATGGGGSTFTYLQTTQEYLNAKLGTVGLTKQQCLQRLAGPAGQNMTAQDAALNYAGLNDRSTIQNALKNKVGGATARDVDITTQEAARRL